MLSSPNLLESLLKENSELTERVTSLSQERATLKHRLTCLERQLRRTESELAKVTTETENRPINDVTSNSKVSRKHFCFDRNNNMALCHYVHELLSFLYCYCIPTVMDLPSS